MSARAEGFVKGNRFPVLDLLRIGAAVAVVLYHFTGRQAKAAWGGQDVHDLFPVLSGVTQYGFLGVEMFFLISGFVIFMSSSGRTVRQFAASRVARLYPAYWVAVLMTASLQAWIAPQLDKTVSVSQVLVNLTMFQAPLRVKHVDGVYWTLWIEMIFYIVIALLILLKFDDRGMLVFSIVWPVFGLVLTLIGPDFMISGLGVKYAPYFAFGMLLYLVHKNGNQPIYWVALVCNAIIGVRQTVTFDVVDQQIFVGRPLSEAVVVVVLVSMFILISFVVLGPARHRGGKWMFWVGGLTYPLYLIHEYWGWWLISIIDPIAGRWAAVFAALVVSVVLAYLIRRYAEEPLQPILKKLILRKQSASMQSKRRVRRP